MASFLIAILPTKIRESILSYKCSIGLILGCLIIAIWTISLNIFVQLNIAETNIILIIISILWQTFLFTGLFITAHDAMHGVVYPDNSKINDSIGCLTVFLYAFFSYQQLRKRHGEHHKNPATKLDPDYHNGKHKNFFAWYFYFMFRYWSWLRFLGMTIAYHSVKNILHIPESNLILFWAIPLLLSSLQLFYFGTYLPHREPLAGYQNFHRTQSTYRPFFWSLITCYHFGYHEEHHKYPYTPWWQLPYLRKNLMSN